MYHFRLTPAHLARTNIQWFCTDMCELSDTFKVDEQTHFLVLTQSQNKQVKTTPTTELINDHIVEYCLSCFIPVIYNRLYG